MPQFCFLRRGMRIRFFAGTYLNDRGFGNTGFRKASGQAGDLLLALPEDVVFQVEDVRIEVPGFGRRYEYVKLRVVEAPDPRMLKKPVELSIWELDHLIFEDGSAPPARPHRILEEYDPEDSDG